MRPMPKITLLEKNPAILEQLNQELLLPNGKLALLSYKRWEKINHDYLRIFAHENSRYGLPTIELVDYLKNIIGDKKAIEIGAGHGDLGYHLGIPMTDSRSQERADIKLMYQLAQQPPIQYPKDVEKLEALEAIKKYKPEIVIASWVTILGNPEIKSYGCNPEGVDERKIINSVDMYILIGNLQSHGDKPTMDIPHQSIKEPFIISRSGAPTDNRIFIWKKEKKS